MTGTTGIDNEVELKHFNVKVCTGEKVPGEFIDYKHSKVTIIYLDVSFFWSLGYVLGCLEIIKKCNFVPEAQPNPPVF